MFGKLLRVAFGLEASVANTQPGDSLSAQELRDIAVGGVLKEDVLDKVYNISPYETPYLDAIGGGTYANAYHEVTQDTLAATTLADAQADGATVTPTTSATGARVANHGQISTEGVNVGYVAEASDPIGRTSEVAYQTVKRLHELRNKIEATCLSRQASQIAGGSGAPTTVGRTAGLGAWLETNTNHGSGGSAGGFNTSTGVIDAPTTGTSRALTWALMSARIEAGYLIGAKPTKVYSRPEVTKRLGQYLITSDFFVAPVANINGQGVSEVQMSGYVDTFKTDFGYTMSVHPVRNQLTVDSADTNSAADACDLFGVDPAYIGKPEMWGPKVEELGKDGLSVRKMISTHWSHDVWLERAHFGIYDLQPTATVAAS